MGGEGYKTTNVCVWFKHGVATLYNWFE
jgi:hypothetical protein